MTSEREPTRQLGKTQESHAFDFGLVPRHEITRIWVWVWKECQTSPKDPLAGRGLSLTIPTNNTKFFQFILNSNYHIATGSCSSFPSPFSCVTQLLQIPRTSSTPAPLGKSHQTPITKCPGDASRSVMTCEICCSWLQGFTSCSGSNPQTPLDH